MVSPYSARYATRGQLNIVTDAEASATVRNSPDFWERLALAFFVGEHGCHRRRQLNF